MAVLDVQMRKISLDKKHIYIYWNLPGFKVPSELLLVNITTYCIALFDELN